MNMAEREGLRRRCSRPTGRLRCAVAFRCRNAPSVEPSFLIPRVRIPERWGWERKRGHLGPLAKFWRRGRDSNPRYSREYNGFRDRPVRPLRHLSEFLNRAGSSRHGGANPSRFVCRSGSRPDMCRLEAYIPFPQGIRRRISQSLPTRRYWKRSCRRLGRPCQNSNSSGCRR